jgi:hypothetical protein
MPRRSRYQPTCEELETRNLFATSTLDITGSTLTFTVAAGTSATIDTVDISANVTFDAGAGNIINTTGGAGGNGFSGGTQTVTGSLVAAVSITQIIIQGGGPGAVFTFNPMGGFNGSFGLTVASSIASTIFSGNGPFESGSNGYNYQSTGGSIIIDSPVTLAASSGFSALNNVTFGSTVDGGQTLYFYTFNGIAGNVTLDGVVGGSQPIAGMGTDSTNPLTINCPNLTALGPSMVNSLGGFGFSGPISLGTSVTMTSPGGANFANSVAGNGNDLTLNFAGNGAIFNAANFTGIHNFTLIGNAFGNAAAIVTSGSQTYSSFFVNSNSTLSAPSIAVNGNLTLGSSPTTATSTLSVAGNLSLTGTLTTTLGGASPSQYGNVVSIGGGITLNNAALSLNFGNGFVPRAGQKFVIVDVTGQFTNVPPGPYMQNQVTFIASYTSGPAGTDFVLTVAQSPASPTVVVAAAGAGGAPLVNVYNAANGQLITSFYAFAPSFTGGVRVAVADVNSDGTPDIICGAGPGGGPEVAVFNGTTFQRIMDFEALPATFTGGVWVAAGDVNGDGFADIIVAADAGGGPQVTITSGKDGSTLTSFYATASTFTGGIRVACADINGDGFADVIAAAGPGGGPQVTIFDGKSLTLLTAFYALPATFTGGVFVAAGDLNGDGKADIIIGAEKGGGPEVNVFNGAGISAGSGTPPSLYAFYALPPTFTGGVRVGYSSNFEGQAAILSVAGAGGGPQVSIFDGVTMANLDSFYAFAPTFGGGVYVGGN